MKLLKATYAVLAVLFWAVFTLMSPQLAREEMEHGWLIFRSEN